MMAEIYAVINESTRQGGGWVHQCGAVLLAAHVTHPIHDSAIPLAGSGQVYTETVPYCPKCQSKPSPNGSPVRQNPVEVAEREILRRKRLKP
jgi:hypothetical protein